MVLDGEVGVEEAEPDGDGLQAVGAGVQQAAPLVHRLHRADGRVDPLGDQLGRGVHQDPRPVPPGGRGDAAPDPVHHVLGQLAGREPVPPTQKVNGRGTGTLPPTTVPLGLANFAYDFASIRPLAERDHKNIVSWHTYDRGSHFAAHDAPDLLVDDLRQFFAALR